MSRIETKVPDSEENKKDIASNGKRKKDNRISSQKKVTELTPLPS